MDETLLFWDRGRGGQGGPLAPSSLPVHCSVCVTVTNSHWQSQKFIVYSRLYKGNLSLFLLNNITLSGTIESGAVLMIALCWNISLMMIAINISLWLASAASFCRCLYLSVRGGCRPGPKLRLKLCADICKREKTQSHGNVNTKYHVLNIQWSHALVLQQQSGSEGDTR